MRLYQATTDVNGVEEDVLKMTKFLYKIADGVAVKAIEMIRYILREKECDMSNERSDCSGEDCHGHHSIHSHEMKRSCETGKEQGDKAKKFIFQIGIDRPLDFPDTVSLHATKKLTFCCTQ